MATSLMKPGNAFTVVSGTASTPAAPALPADAISMLEDMESVLRTALCSERTDAIKHELRGLYVRYQDFRDKYPEDLPIARVTARVRAHFAEQGEGK